MKPINSEYNFHVLKFFLCLKTYVLNEDTEYMKGATIPSRLWI